MPIRLLQPADLSETETATVLDFFNSTSNAEAIARTIEFPDELDIGVNLARRLLLQRTQLGGRFETLEQLAATPYIGPERFTEIVSALTGRPLYDNNANADLPLLARELARLQRQMARLSSSGGSSKIITLSTLESPTFVGREVPLLLRVTDSSSHQPVADTTITLSTQWGYLSQYQNLGHHQGRVTEVVTDYNGEARFYHIPPHNDWLSTEQQSALSSALTLLNPNAESPLADSEGFQLLAQRYMHQRNQPLRQAIDCYFVEQKKYLEQSFSVRNWLHQWVFEDVAIQATLRSHALQISDSEHASNTDNQLSSGQIEAQGLLTFRLKRWLGAWYMSLQNQFQQQNVLQDELNQAREAVGDKPALSDYLMTRLHSFIAGSRGIAEETVSQQAADRAIQGFIIDGMADLSAATQAALFPALNIASQTIRSTGMGTLAAVTQTRSELKKDIARVSTEFDRGQFDQLNTRLAALEPRLNDFDNRYAQFTQDYQRFDSNYRSFDNNLQSFNNDFQSFRGDYTQFNTDYGDFRGELGNVRGDLGNFDNQLTEFNTRYSQFTTEANTLTVRMDATNREIININNPNNPTRRG